MSDGSRMPLDRGLLEARLAHLVRTENDYLERISARELRVGQRPHRSGRQTLSDPVRERLEFLLADVRKNREAVERRLAQPRG